MVLNLPNAIVGSSLRLSRHLVHRNITELLFVPWSRDRRNAKMAQFVARCPLLDGRLKVFRAVAGPSFDAFSTVGVRGFTMFKDIIPSPHELPNAKTSMWPDLAPRVLRMNGPKSMRYYKRGCPPSQARLI